MTRVYLVTGASRGVGAEIAAQVTGPQRHVIVNYREKTKRADDVVEAVRAAGGSADAVRADVTDERAVTAMFDDVDRRFQPSGYVGARCTRRIGTRGRPWLRDAAQPRRAGAAGSAGASADALRRAHRLRHQPSGALPRQQTRPLSTTSPRHQQAGRRGSVARHAPRFEAAGVAFVVVSGDMIEGSTMVRLFSGATPRR